VLKPKDTIGILKLGGTILGTTNKGHFAAKVGKGDIAEVPPEIVAKAKQTMDELGITALVIVGGDGSLTTGLQLYREGWPIIGVPKTIDNDLSATAFTFGFDSAVNTVVDALDRLHTTGESHKRIMLLEVMGRHAGWIALWGGIAGGANVVLLPEIPFTFEKITEFINQRDAQGYHSTLVVVAEGASMPDGHIVTLDANTGGETGGRRPLRPDGQLSVLSRRFRLHRGSRPPAPPRRAGERARRRRQSRRHLPRGLRGFSPHLHANQVSPCH